MDDATYLKFIVKGKAAIYNQKGMKRRDSGLNKLWRKLASLDRPYG